MSEIYKIFRLNIKKIKISLQPSEAISAGIATAIKPTAAVAVSNEVLKAHKKFYLSYSLDMIPFVSINTMNSNLYAFFFNNKIRLFLID